MPFKLIGTVILLVLVTVFCGFNNGEGYRCNVNLLFRTFTDVPVFLTVIASFAAGMVITLPFTFGRRRKGDKAPKEPKQKKASRGLPLSDVPEVKVTVRPGTIYDGSSAQNGAAFSSAANGATGVRVKSPFEQARENAKAAKEKREAEKAAKREAKDAAKKAKSDKKNAGSKEPPAELSVNEVPKIYS